MGEKFIEDVDDLDLYMKIYPEAKRRLESARKQVDLIEAEMERREVLRYGLNPLGKRLSMWLRRLHNTFWTKNLDAVKVRQGAPDAARADGSLAMLMQNVNGGPKDEPTELGRADDLRLGNG